MGDADAESVSAVASRCAVPRPRIRVRVRVEIMGPGMSRNVGKSQISAVLIMSNPMISTRTRISGQEQARGSSHRQISAG
eukprot:COSAG01_NODE_1900_length_8964_cov_121.219177_14_plen_80_part_00